MNATTPKVRKKDNRISNSKEALKRALLSLLEEREFAQISVLMVTQRAGIGYATFFRHYDSAEALLIEIADALHAELTAAMASASQSDDRREAMAILAEYVEDNRGSVHAIVVRAGPFVQRAVTSRATEAARRSLSKMDASIPFELAIRHAVASTFVTLSWWLEEERPNDPEALTDLLVQFVVTPLLGSAPSDLGSPNHRQV